MNAPRFFLATGVASTLLYLAVWHLSLQFNWGEGYADRPILSYLAIYFTLFALYAAACLRLREEAGNARMLGLIIAFGLIFRAAIFPAQQIQEDDVYRYLWDGKVFANQINPFKFSPEDISYATEFRIRHPIAFRNTYDEASRKELEFLNNLRWSNETALIFFDRINHPDVPTIYPPLAQFVFASVAVLKADNIYLLRGAFLIFDLITLFFIIRSLQALGRNINWCAVYFWCPLIIKETFNSTHLDIIGIAFLSGSIYFFIARRASLSIAFLSLSVLGKLYPVILLPLYLKRFTWSETVDWKRAIGLTSLFSLIVLLGYLPFMDIGMKMFTGLNTFTAYWQNNDSIFALIAWFYSDAIRLDSNLLLFEKYRLPEFAAKVTVAVLLLSAVGYYFFKKGKTSTEACLQSLFVIMALVFLLSPVQNPWYLCWSVPFLCFYPLRSGILLTGLVSFYYLDFYFDYQNLDAYVAWIPWFEYLPFYAALLWEWRQRQETRLQEELQ